MKNGGTIFIATAVEAKTCYQPKLPDGRSYAGKKTLPDAQKQKPPGLAHRAWLRA
jgi:hypothetical protein